MTVRSRVALVWRFLCDIGLFVGLAALLLVGALVQSARADVDGTKLETSTLRIKERGKALSTYIEMDYARDHALQWGQDRGANADAVQHPRKRLNETYGALYARLKLTQVAPLRTSSSDCRGSPVANIFHALGYGRQSGIISITLSTALLRGQAGSTSGARVSTLQSYPILVLMKEGKNCSYEWVGEKALTPWVLTGVNGVVGAEVEIEILHQIAAGEDLQRARKLLKNARSLADLLGASHTSGIIADLDAISGFQRLLRSVDTLVAASGEFRNLSTMKGKILPFEAGTGDAWDRITLKIPTIRTNGNRVKIDETELTDLFALEVEYRPTMFAECSTQGQKKTVVNCAGFDLSEILSSKISGRSIQDIASTPGAGASNGSYVGFLGKLWSAAQSATDDAALKVELKTLCRRDWDLNEMVEFRGLNKLDRLLVKYALLSEVIDYNRRPRIQSEECLSLEARGGGLSEEDIIRSLTHTDINHVIRTEDPQGWARRMSAALGLELRKIGETNLKQRFETLFVGNDFELVIHPDVAWVAGPGSAGSTVKLGFEAVSALSSIGLDIPAYCSLNATDMRDTKGKVGFWISLQPFANTGSPRSAALIAEFAISRDGPGLRALDGMKIRRLQFVSADTLLEEMGWNNTPEERFIRSGCARGKELAGIKAHLKALAESRSPGDGM